jgi:chromosome segregation ATPase
MRKQRLFWRFKEMLAKQKFQNEINMLKKQVSNNSYLWDQMAEAEKREKILKQELLFTQQSLAAAEKVIEKLQEEMRKYEAVQQRLKRYKDQNAERLKEYEDKLKKFEVYENIDTDKLINVLSKKD